MLLCKDLGIDDPVFWMNSVEPEIVDLWVAFYIVSDSEEKEMKDPAQAINEVFKRHG